MSIDHDEARRIAQGLGKTYHLAGDAEIKLVFDAYLQLQRRITTALECLHDSTISDNAQNAVAVLILVGERDDL